MQEFDYVVVGGGSAGCALAGRLSEDPKVSVCVLEAGGPDSSALVHAPLGLAVMLPHGLMNSWHYSTTPQKGLNGRKGFQPRGKVLGGSSSVNAMVYTRGNRHDYDGWAALGNPGWSYKDVLPLFKRAENSHCFSNNEYHGNSGPQHVSYLRSPSTLNAAFTAACVEQGIPRNPDYNGAQQYGVSPAQTTQFGGERWNTARAYLHANAGRKNLTVLTGCHTRKVLLEGKRAVGVEMRRAGQISQVKARKEVILSAGAYGSPQLLLLSGIGPQAHLREMGIAVALDVPGVGQNLQDHITSSIIFRSPRQKDTLGVSLQGVWAILKAIFEWRNKRTGWVTSCMVETQGFISTCGNTDHPDIQIAVIPSIVDDHTRKMHMGHGITLHTTLLRPKSRGSVTLQSADPHQAPLIDPAFLQHPDDMAVTVKGAQMGFEILLSKAMDGFRGKPLADVDHRDPVALEKYLRNTCDTEYHPVGTCKMGPDSDPMAVVDASLRVKGISGLRVVDTSIMPCLMSGNTNAPAIMIGEKAADLIRTGA
jgi:choline dehydrogenase-like flavoprotein